MRIEPLRPDQAAEYVAYFADATKDNPFWTGCYCAYYDDSCADADWNPTSEAAHANAANRTRTIEEGQAFGLFAYEGSEPVGWVNAGPRDSYVNLRHLEVAVQPDDPVIGSVMCFVIHHEHRGNGIASQLLEAVDEYFLDLGVAVAEGYPRTAPPAIPDFPWEAAYYKGTSGMFAKAGYKVHSEHEGFNVVRKELS